MISRDARSASATEGMLINKLVPHSTSPNSPEVRQGRRRGLENPDAWINLAFLVRLAGEHIERRQRTKITLKRTEPAFIEPMQCKPFTALPTGESELWDPVRWLSLHRGKAGKRGSPIFAPPEVAQQNASPAQTIGEFGQDSFGKHPHHV